MNVKLRSSTLASATALDDDAACIRLPKREGKNRYSQTETASKTKDWGGVGLAEIEAALGRLDAGVFGLCHACGGQISLETLKRNPVATHCGRCK